MLFVPKLASCSLADIWALELPLAREEPRALSRIICCTEAIISINSTGMFASAVAPVAVATAAPAAAYAGPAKFNGLRESVNVNAGDAEADTSA